MIVENTFVQILGTIWKTKQKCGIVETLPASPQKPQKKKQKKKHHAYSPLLKKKKKKTHTIKTKRTSDNVGIVAFSLTSSLAKERGSVCSQFLAWIQ